MNAHTLALRGFVRPIPWAWLATLMVVGWVLVRQASWQSSEQLHTLLEVVAATLALAAGLFALARYYAIRVAMPQDDSTTFLFIATAFLGTAALDAYHAVVTSSFVVDRFPSAPADLAPWSWLGARLFLGGVLLISSVAWRAQGESQPLARVDARAVFVGGAATTLAVGVFLATVPMPPAHYPAFPIHRPQELLPAVLFLLALGAYLHKGLRMRDTFEWWLTLSLVVGVAGQVAFMPLSAGLYDPMFDAAHLLKLGSYGLVLVGLVSDGRQTFVRAARSTRELAETRSLLLAAIEHTPAGVIVAEAPDGGIRLVNTAALQIGGFTRDAVEGMTIYGYQARWHAHHPDGTPFAADELPLTRAIRRGDTSVDVELLLRPRDGDERWVSVNAAPVRNADGATIAGVSVFLDVTDRRQLEAEFRAAQKMEAVGRLAGGIAHDFNNILTSVIGYTDLILEQIDADKPIYRDLCHIRTGGERARTLTRQLLAFGRKQVLKMAAVDLNDVVADVDALTRPMLGEDIVVSTRLAPNLRAIRADANHLQQVLLNLTVNARDAMPEGGHLTVTTDNVEVTRPEASNPPMPAGPYVTLAVRDTGTGMAADVREHLFEPFFTTKAVGEGTGLGLAMVYGTVKQLGGFIWVDSEPGRGSCFTLHFPSSDKPVERPETPSAPAPGHPGSETVLVVEDDEDVRRFAGDVLRRFGYHVVEADGPAAALERAGVTGTLDLLLSDVVMPGVTGPELADTLRRTHPDLKIIFMSGYSELAVAQRGVLAASTEFLEKPLTPSVLLRTVRRVLGSPPGPRQDA